MKPMLAATIEDVSKLRFPLYASPKLDGIRGVIVDGVLKSRSLKSIPNTFVSKRFSKAKYNGLDGELILGSPTAKDVYRQTKGACARHYGEPDVKFYVFDNFEDAGTYKERWIEDWLPYNDELPHVVVHEQTLVENAVDLMTFENDCLDFGYEGVILRDPQGAYKFGRSTLREQGMMKLKRFSDGEANVIGVYEEMENTNVKKTNELGRGQRSHHQAGMVPKGTAGGFLLEDIVSHQVFKCGTGLTDVESAEWWARRKDNVKHTMESENVDYYKLKKPVIVKYKSFKIGVKDKPRHPVYLGIREKWDL